MSLNRILHRCLWLAALALAHGAVAAPAADPYDAAESWLCRPGRTDACSADQTAVRVAADGAMTREPWAADPAAAVDCFYVYPTISEDPAGNSGLVAGPGEKRAVAQQFARFAAVCRPFAPMYRQITLAGLRSYFTGGSLPIDPELAYADVRAAWRHYLTHDNRGRGVVLIGHSQGARMLTQLLQREIEGSPAQARIVSALLIGSNVEVPAEAPRGARVGGSFKSLPLCESGTQTGCVVSYVSYRAGKVPPANALFGRSRTPGMTVACTDPATLTGGELRPYLTASASLLGQPIPLPAWNDLVAKAGTPYVSLPGLLAGRCVSEGGASFYAVAMQPATQDARPSAIPGDLVVGGAVREDWGLHLIDVNLAAGNLIDLVRRQAASFGATGRSSGS